MEERKKRVLLVDDDMMLSHLLVDELKEKGYEVHYQSSVFGVGEAIRKFEPDVLVFDVEIAAENGIEYAKELFGGNPHLPIIFISSHHEEEMKSDGLLTAGGVAYLDKPFSSKLLAAHIERFARMEKISSKDDANIVKLGNAQLDKRNRALILADGTIKELRLMEFDILSRMLLNANEIVSREDLFYSVWKNQCVYYNEQSLNNYIRRLRLLFEDNNTGVAIALHRNVGYRLENI